MQLSDRVKIPPQVMARDVEGELVLLELASGTYFGLNTVGARIWHHMSAGKTLDEICDMIVDEFEVTRETLEGDTIKLAQDLETKGLITLATTEDPVR